jgi:hypothetical protein
VWSSELPRGVELKLDDGNDYVCSAYSSRGWLIDDEDECTDTNAKLAVMIEGQERLDVELL